MIMKVTPVAFISKGEDFTEERMKEVSIELSLVNKNVTFDDVRKICIFTALKSKIYMTQTFGLQKRIHEYSTKIVRGEKIELLSNSTMDTTHIASALISDLSLSGSITISSIKHTNDIIKLFRSIISKVSYDMLQCIDYLRGDALGWFIIMDLESDLVNELKQLDMTDEVIISSMVKAMEMILSASSEELVETKLNIESNYQLKFVDLNDEEKGLVM